ncbi:cobalt transporter ATP-binding subunit [Salmonella enterica subsp. arizonae]|uniref:Cobalt transporter ATP-binding subunit n=1 Tax=Salmonella enterica subsp. arizonae TaxID=59203 RepID=A0A379T950_SALER|nr:cobalt transporter ATP-binding subunit [Salmonella enterica subsp. arizonae]
MLATSDLWFRYQDEPVLKGLNLDFSLSACYRFGGRERLWKVYAFYEPERPVASAKRGCVVAGKTTGLQQARTTGAAPASCDGFFRTPNSRFFIRISIAILRLVYVIWGCRRRKSRAALTRR